MLNGTLEGVFHTENQAKAYAVELACAFMEATCIREVSNGWEVWAGPKL